MLVGEVPSGTGQWTGLGRSAKHVCALGSQFYKVSTDLPKWDLGLPSPQLRPTKHVGGHAVVLSYVLVFWGDRPAVLGLRQSWLKG